MSQNKGWEPGTECVGKYNFPGSASHVSGIPVCVLWCGGGGGGGGGFSLGVTVHWTGLLWSIGLAQTSHFQCGTEAEYAYSGC